MQPNNQSEVEVATKEVYPYKKWFEWTLILLLVAIVIGLIQIYMTTHSSQQTVTEEPISQETVLSTDEDDVDESSEIPGDTGPDAVPLEFETIADEDDVTEAELITSEGADLTNNLLELEAVVDEDDVATDQ